jgi:dUTP pyrophosphatase
MLPVTVVRLDPDLPLPTYAHPGDAGLDLHARDGERLAAGGGRALVPTGIAIAIPPGHAAFVLPRSGLALRHGVTVVNSPGLIDASYRGEVKVVLVNLGTEPYEAEAGDRIAQLLLVPCLTPELRTVDELPPSADGRGEAGFGSSGR